MQSEEFPAIFERSDMWNFYEKETRKACFVDWISKILEVFVPLYLYVNISEYVRVLKKKPQPKNNNPMQK